MQLAALVRTPSLAPVPGRAVDFSVGGLTADGITDAGGRATATVDLELPASSYTLQIDVPALQGAGIDATTTAPFMVTANGAPVANVGGPYDTVCRRWHRTQCRTVVRSERRRHHGDMGPRQRRRLRRRVRIAPVIADPPLQQLVCGGACTNLTTLRPVKARVVDTGGASAIAQTTIRFHRDFGLHVSPSSVTLNPGGSASLQVQVSTTSGFDQPVALSVPDLPTGVTAHFFPDTITPNGQSILSLTAAPARKPRHADHGARGRRRHHP